MQRLAPVGGVYQAGTLSGNPVATAAGLATLRLATPAVYAHVDRVSGRAAGRGRRRADAAGVPHVIQRAGNLFSVFFVGEGVTAVPDFAIASRPVHRRVRGVLPCDAGFRRLSAAQRVRGLVFVRGPR